MKLLAVRRLFRIQRVVIRYRLDDLLFALPRERGSTLALVTHDPALAARCDRTLRMRSGVVEAAA